MYIVTHSARNGNNGPMFKGFAPDRIHARLELAGYSQVKQSYPVPATIVDHYAKGEDVVTVTSRDADGDRVYRVAQLGPDTWSVGFKNHNGEWITEHDHETREDAMLHCKRLNEN